MGDRFVKTSNIAKNVMQKFISITQQAETLFVDSRLIARKLGVRHRGWYRNIIIMYQNETELAFGRLHFETTTVINRFDPVNHVKFALLTEDQAIFLMTLTRNTPEVVNCKLMFVKSVSETKRMLGY